MVKDKDKSDKEPSGREPNEMLELLKSFYTPDEKKDIQDFSEFYSSLESKLSADNASARMMQTTTELENQYLERQQRLEQFLRRMDEANFNPLDKLKKRKKKKILLTVLFLLIATFLLIYFFQNFKIVPV